MVDDNEWGVNANTFLRNSFQHWQENRYDSSPEALWPTIEQILSGDKHNTSSGAALPVCYSPQRLLNDDNADKILPCICGDQFGNETKSFFQEANFPSWVAFKDGKGLAEVRRL